jgi:hypothetical protein
MNKQSDILFLLVVTIVAALVIGSINNIALDRRLTDLEDRLSFVEQNAHYNEAWFSDANVGIGGRIDAIEHHIQQQPGVRDHSYQHSQIDEMLSQTVIHALNPEAHTHVNRNASN